MNTIDNIIDDMGGTMLDLRELCAEYNEGGHILKRDKIAKEIVANVTELLDYFNTPNPMEE